MHEALLAQAALPAPSVICGLLMRPYSLGHELFLVREANPILTDPVMADKGHLLQAAWICSCTFRECKETPYAWLSWLKQQIVLWRNRKTDVTKEISRWLEYRKQGCLEFKRSEITYPGESSRRVGAPVLLQLHSFVMAYLRLPEFEAWDYPAGLAKMRWQAHWETEGCYRIYTEAEALHDEAVAEFEREEQEANRCPA